MQSPGARAPAQAPEGFHDLAIHGRLVHDLRRQGNDRCHHLVKVVLVQAAVRAQRTDESARPCWVGDVRVSTRMKEQELPGVCGIHRDLSSWTSFLIAVYIDVQPGADILRGETMGAARTVAELDTVVLD